jgi:hypothetical protein
VAGEPESRLEWGRLRPDPRGANAGRPGPGLAKQATHIEFANTTIKFDAVRRDDGNPAFQPEPWDPTRGRVVLRLARPVFPEIRPWTEDIVDARYDPRTKLLAAIYGEPQRRDQWP